MFCPHCGRSMPDGTRFCTECGTQIRMPAQAQQPINDYGPPQVDYGPPQANYGPPQANYGPPQVDAPRMSANQVTQQPVGALQTNRELITYILLTLVTCGIYGYWFVYRMAQDANVACANDGEETPGLAVYILLSIVTCGIYSYYWMYKLANRIKANAPTYGIVIQEGGSDVLIWFVLGLITCSLGSFVAMNIIIKNMNTLCMAYNRSHGYV